VSHEEPLVQSPGKKAARLVASASAVCVGPRDRRFSEAEVPIEQWNWEDISLASGQSESVEITLSEAKRSANARL
jgi:hypothetical protein